MTNEEKWKKVKEILLENKNYTEARLEDLKFHLDLSKLEIKDNLLDQVNVVMDCIDPNSFAGR